MIVVVIVELFFDGKQYISVTLFMFIIISISNVIIMATIKDKKYQNIILCFLILFCFIFFSFLIKYIIYNNIPSLLFFVLDFIYIYDDYEPIWIIFYIYILWKVHCFIYIYITHNVYFYLFLLYFINEFINYLIYRLHFLYIYYI